MAETATVDYLDPQTLASVGPLALRARHIVEGLQTGMHRSPYFGYSVEFSQHRQYAPGDDLRHLDWKVFGRSDKLYLKQYQKETNLDLMLLVDVSGSMSYDGSLAKPRRGRKGKTSAGGGAWRKYDHAAALAATIAYLGLKQQDRVGLVLFADTIRNATRMSNAHDHWRAIVDTLASQQIERELADGDLRAMSDPSFARATDLGKLFDQIIARLTRRSLIVLISDLFDDPAVFERGLARMHHRRHDLIVLQTLDHAERTFPFRATSDFCGLEGEGRLGLDPRALREAYLERLAEHLRQIEDLTRKFGNDYMLLDTSESLGPPLSHFLAHRAARLNRRRA